MTRPDNEERWQHEFFASDRPEQPDTREGRSVLSTIDRAIAGTLLFLQGVLLVVEFFATMSFAYAETSNTLILGAIAAVVVGALVIVAASVALTFWAMGHELPSSWIPIAGICVQIGVFVSTFALVASALR